MKCGHGHFRCTNGEFYCLECGASIPNPYEAEEKKPVKEPVKETQKEPAKKPARKRKGES